MHRFLEKAIKEAEKDVEILEVNSDTEKAIDLAIEHGIEDIPGCVIGDTKFFGKRGFSYSGILEAMKQLP